MFWVHPVLTLSVKNEQWMMVCVLGTPCTNLVGEKCAVDVGLCFMYTLY